MSAAVLQQNNIALFKKDGVNVHKKQHNTNAKIDIVDNYHQQKQKNIKDNNNINEDEMYNENERITKKDKIQKNKCLFVLGSIYIWISIYWIGYYPSSFYRLYSILAVILLTLRWKCFKQKKMHYYMFDFCYMVHFIFLCYLWIMPHSKILYKIVFAYNSGPLAWAVILFKNSLVYHSLHEVTSLFLHWYPMLVSWTLRWHFDCKLMNVCEANDHKQSEWYNANCVDLILWPFMLYLIWALLYYLKIFMISARRIKERQYSTLYTYMITTDPLCHKFITKFSPKYRPLGYMIMHMFLISSSLLLGILWWNSYWSHTLWIISVTLVSSWNGSNHYFNTLNA